MVQSARKRSEVAIDSRLLAEACDLKLDVSRAAEEGLRRAMRAEKERIWRIENAEAIQAANDFVDKYGLPLAKYRMF